MNQYRVVVTNGSKARFFTLQDAEYPENQSSPYLIETSMLLHPDHDQARKEREFQRANIDHEIADPPAHHPEFDRRFAFTIINKVSRMSQKANHSPILLNSKKVMLRHLRKAANSALKSIETHEVAKDLSKLRPLELHSYFAKENLLPARKGPSH